MTDIGRVAFEAYIDSLRARGDDSDKAELQPWERLWEPIQDAWRAAGLAAVSSRAIGPLALRPIGGLANRLRTILSRMDRPLVVDWRLDEEIAGAHFLDVFGPLPGVLFAAHKAGPEIVETCEPTTHGGAWQERYRLLEPLAHIKARIASIVDELTHGGPFDAMHVRRTDNVAYAKSENAFVADEEFLAFAEQAARETVPVYLATDNRDTQDRLSVIGAQRLFVNRWIDREPGTVRHTTLAETVVDAYVCAKARRFKGCPSSSFSALIETLRRLG